MTKSAYESGVLFTQAHRLVRQRIVDVLANHNISFGQWSILTVVANAQDGIRLSNVAARLNVKAPLITMESKSLIDEGLVMLLPHHSDSRAKLLVITPTSKKLLGTVESELNQQIEQLMTGLTPVEIQTFQKILITIIGNS